MKLSLSYCACKKLIVASAFTCATLSLAQAQTTYTWDGGGADVNWSTATNWAGDTVPPANNYLSFGTTATAQTLNNDLGTFNLRKLRFTDAGSYALSGNALNLGGTVGDIPEIELFNFAGAATILNDINENGTVGNKVLEMRIVNGEIVLGGTVSGSTVRNVNVSDGGGSSSLLRVNGNMATRGNLNLGSANVTFDLNDPGTYTAYIGANGVNNGILGSGSATMDGTLDFDLSSASTTIGDSWTIVGVSATYGGTFGVQGFTESTDFWTGSANGATYGFSEQSGILSVIPEPSTYALVLGLGALCSILIRRQNRR